MKKILSLFLSLFIIVSCSSFVLAVDTTVITYEGENTSFYEITVPKSIQPGEAKAISGFGSWDSNTVFNFTCPEKVILVNNLDGKKIELDITFNDVVLKGDNYSEIPIESEISVERIEDSDVDFQRFLFGTFKGYIIYEVSFDTTDLEYSSFIVDEDSTNVYVYEVGMTWEEWVNSDYNYNGFEINNDGETIFIMDNDGCILGYMAEDEYSKIGKSFGGQVNLEDIITYNEYIGDTYAAENY